jgi:hypothetical protein
MNCTLILEKCLIVTERSAVVHREERRERKSAI